MGILLIILIIGSALNINHKKGKHVNNKQYFITHLRRTAA